MQEYGDEYWIVGVTVTTMFETAWALRGYQQMLIDLVVDPDLADRLRKSLPLSPGGGGRAGQAGRGHDLDRRRYRHAAPC